MLEQSLNTRLFNLKIKNVTEKKRKKPFILLKLELNFVYQFGK